ncbi:MAG TPA: M14 metallopeptidase family protein [Gemmatimonadota bacterium]|nr:M14 metallopeptidase family protein [Gemmatimonadota bacterium]
MRDTARHALALVLLVLAAATPLRAQQAVPTPDDYVGFKIGSDRHLADWSQVTGYMEALAEASPRVQLDTLGPTTLGRPFVMLTIASRSTLADLDHFHAIQMKLADPRTISSPEEADSLIHEGKAVVLITSSIHSTEVGGTQAPMKIAYRLATSEKPLARKIRDNTIVLLVPSLNPDGLDMVVHWYRSTVGKPWEAASPPFLYHHYAGHDNNRDWYYFALQETNLTVRDAQNAWHPQIVHDIHQQGQRGSRFFIPPWIDPYEPNVDPLLTESINDIGTHMAWRMGTQGHEGVVVDAIYDAWTPARAYQHYHAGARILTETASADMATPITVPADSLRPGRNFDARKRSWNFPEPWPGGEWHLSDIIGYMEDGAFALLEHAADNRERWLRSFLEIGRKAVAKWERWPDAWVIPAGQANRTGLQELIRVMVTADVEVRRAGADFQAGGHRFSAGDYVIPMHQPYASFAQAMLERQEYPDLRQYPGGPPRRPYDVTAQTLPLLLGVDAVPVDDLPAGSVPLSDPMASAPEPRRTAPGLSGEQAGKGAPRIALYQSWSADIDEGWTRWVFDRYHIPYTTVHNADLKAGDLSSRFDVVVFASESPRTIYFGRPKASVPDSLAGGVGARGVAALEDFVEDGGTVVTLQEASRFAIDYLGAPVRDVTAGLRPEEFYIPGSILRLDLDTSSPLARGMPDSTAAWYGRSSMAFVPTDSGVRVVGRYGEKDPLLSGWALGSKHVAGRPALVEVPRGRGRIVLFGFRPQYRVQSVATFPLLFDALRR